ncbi:hypothetical protein ACIQMR_35460 [Streptomyces sp. NPDC091376]|uniref:hypothetical protein n=1 Tax=Streptomyces sp. NPDC091376 TaxID=3365994 RepID=UPI0037F115E3
MADIKVGDEVRVIRNTYEYEGDENIGRVGKLLKVDTDEQPYLVEFDDRTDWWCADVEPIVPPSTEDAEAPDREAFVSRARELLRGTQYDASDLIRMAEFLAGGS